MFVYVRVLAFLRVVGRGPFILGQSHRVRGGARRVLAQELRSSFDIVFRFGSRLQHSCPSHRMVPARIRATAEGTGVPVAEAIFMDLLFFYSRRAN